MAESASGLVQHGPLADAEYLAAVIDLIGVIGYGELSAFERLADDAKLAPTLPDKVVLTEMAAQEARHLSGLVARLRELGADPFEAMSPFVAPIEEFHRRTRPSDWYEGLLKAYVGDGLAADLYTEIAALLDLDTRALVMDALANTGQATFAVDRIRTAIDNDPRLGGRLALWGRRLMGEALTQGQRVVAERQTLAAFLAGGIDRPGMDLAAITRMFSRITEQHAARMAALGLDS